jgi:hypothetical protein
MRNGSNKGNDDAVIKTVKSYPDLKGLCSEHYSVCYPDLN